MSMHNAVSYIQASQKMDWKTDIWVSIIHSFIAWVVFGLLWHTWQAGKLDVPYQVVWNLEITLCASLLTMITMHFAHIFTTARLPWLSVDMLSGLVSRYY